MVGPGSGEIYKRDNLLGPEAAKACFYGTGWCTRCRERARGTGAASVRRCCERRRRAGGGRANGVRGARGRAQISLRARVHGSRENREPPPRQKQPRAESGRADPGDTRL